MNRKTIKRVLAKKHENFLKSIDDAEVKKLIRNNSIITGGSIASMLLNERVKDFDYYFLNKETCIAVAKYYVKKFKELHPDVKNQPHVEIETERVKIVVPSAGIASEEADLRDELSEGGIANETDTQDIDKSEKVPYRPICISANAITLSDKVQLVIRFYGSPEEIHENYDFVHCTNSWISKENKLVLNQDALESLLSKNLQYRGSLYPVSSVIRTRKFIKKGWHINAGQYLKMCFQISELDLTNIAVLEEQLTGVDAAYFFEVIDYCKKRQQKDPKFEISTPYLVSIIDKIF